MKELWKPIIGYEGLYEISNTGKVRALETIVLGRNRHGLCNRKRHAKQIAINKSNGYEYVGLTKNGKQKHYPFHRLLAIHFIDNPNNYPCVNHIDENRMNNILENLEWCTYKYNTNYGTNIERAKNTKIKRYGMGTINGKHVFLYDSKMNLINSFDSLTLAAKHIGVSRQAVCFAMKKNKLCHGFAIVST